jgi:AmiR/NasT family two-component response regulator
VAWLRGRRLQGLLREVAELRQSLEDRKLLDRAKGIVMKRLGLDEEGSFRRLRKLASDSNRKVIEVARQVLLAEGFFHDLECLPRQAGPPGFAARSTTYRAARN